MSTVGVQFLLQDLEAFAAQAPVRKSGRSSRKIWTARIGRLRYEITLALQGYRDVLKGERQHVADLQAAVNKLNRKDSDSEQVSDRESKRAEPNERTPRTSFEYERTPSPSGGTSASRRRHRACRGRDLGCCWGGRKRRMPAAGFTIGTTNPKLG